MSGALRRALRHMNSARNSIRGQVAKCTVKNQARVAWLAMHSIAAYAKPLLQYNSGAMLHPCFAERAVQSRACGVRRAVQSITANAKSLEYQCDTHLWAMLRPCFTKRVVLSKAYVTQRAVPSNATYAKYMRIQVRGATLPLFWADHAVPSSVSVALRAVRNISV